MERTSLSQDDIDYYTLKHRQRLAKCRLRARAYALFDLGYTFIHFAILVAVLGFEIRNQLRRAQWSNLNTNGTNSTAEVTVIRLPTGSTSTFTSTIQWLAPLLPGVICALLQLIAAILLWITAARAKSSATRSTAIVLLLRLWMILNLLTLPYAMFKIVTRSPVDPYGYVNAYAAELVFKFLGYLLVYDLIVFTTTVGGPSASGSNDGKGKGGNSIEVDPDIDVDADEELINVYELPGSIGSCLFGKSCCMLVNECC